MDNFIDLLKRFIDEILDIRILCSYRHLYH